MDNTAIRYSGHIRENHHHHPVEMNFQTNNVESLFKYLEDNKLPEFMHSWYSMVPANLRNEDAFQRLTFEVHLFFVARGLKISSHIDDCPEPMKAFKQFLWNNGSYFSCEKEFMPYFVLPFVREPQKNPMFAALFEDTWEQDFKFRLRSFVVSNCDYHSEVQPITIPTLPTDRSSNSRYWKRQYDRLNCKFRSLYEDTEMIIGVMFELIETLKKSVIGQEADIANMLNKCYKTYPSFFNNEVKGTESSANLNLKCKTQTETKLNDVFSINDLDTEKIKTDLLDGGVKTQLQILQALRWIITQTATNESQAAVWLMSEHDVLHLYGDESFLKDMLMPSSSNSPHPTQQTIARLLNALASARTGLNYITCPLMIELLVTVVRNSDFIEPDPITADMLVSVLQKMSWIHHFGELMIKQGLLDWLIKQLLKLTEWNYLFKNSLLLLISLTRYRLAKQICVDASEQVLLFTNKFLSGSYKSTENCEYVFWKYCAFLENVISKPNVSVVHWECMALKFRLTNLDVLRNTCCHAGASISKEDASNFEPEIDTDDPLKMEPCGMQYLRLNYSYKNC